MTPWPGHRATFCEKRSQQGRTLIGTNTRGDAGTVMRRDLVEQGCPVPYRAPLRIVGAVNEMANPRMADGPGAHGAGFEGYKKGGAGQTVISRGQGALAKDRQFGVGRRVALRDWGIHRLGDQLPGRGEEDGADGHFTVPGGHRRKAEGMIHPAFEISVAGGKIRPIHR